MHIIVFYSIKDILSVFCFNVRIFWKFEACLNLRSCNIPLIFVLRLKVLLNRFYVYKQWVFFQTRYNCESQFSISRISFPVVFFEKFNRTVLDTNWISTTIVETEQFVNQWDPQRDLKIEMAMRVVLNKKCCHGGCEKSRGENNYSVLILVHFNSGPKSSVQPLVYADHQAP